MNKSDQSYDLAFTHLKNNQNISAYHQFVNFAEDQKKEDPIKAALLYFLAAECKSKQGKDNNNELQEAGKLFLKYGKKEQSYKAKGAYLCASKCFFKVGQFDSAKDAFNKSKEFQVPQIITSRPVVIIDDSKAITLKLKKFLEKLGYTEIHSFQTGKDGIKGCKKLIDASKNPVVLLDMGLPDIGGDSVASKLLDDKLDLQIIVITADEKSTKRVYNTISSGVTSFIQKPFTIDEVKKAIDVAESEYSLS